MIAISVGWPLIAVKLGIKSASMMPMVTAFGGITALTGVAQLITGIENPYGDFNAYDGWRKGVVLLFGVAGFVVGLRAHFWLTDSLKSSGYMIVTKRGDQEQIDAPNRPTAPLPSITGQALSGINAAITQSLSADGGVRGPSPYVQKR